MKPIDYLCTVIRSVGASFPVASSVVNGWNEIQGRLELEKVHKYLEGIAAKLEEIDGKVSRKKKGSGLSISQIN